MDKILENKQAPQCKICNQPLELLLIGSEPFRMWVHRGKHLETCQAIRLDYSFLALLFARMRKFGWEFGQKIDKYGKLQMHGQ